MTQLDTYPGLVEEARSQFDTAGHVAVRALFDAAQAEAALREVEAWVPPLQYRRNGGIREEVATLKRLRTASPGAAFDNLFERINEGAVTLGHDLMSEPGWGRHIQVIKMEPGGRGRAHTDCAALGGVTAITNLAGRSYLRIDRIGEYRLETGDVAFIQGRALRHQGVGDQHAPRTGLALARIRLAKPKI